MILRSHGLRSDLSLIDGEILDRGDYLVVKSLKQPDFYYGNLLVFPEPPKDGDHARWETLFAKEFSDMPKVKHRTFFWDVSELSFDSETFVSAGYELDQTVVLSASSLKEPPHPNTDIEIRVLQSDADWDELLALQVETRDLAHDEESFTRFSKGRLTGHRRRVEAGQGDWYGAFLGTSMVASLGIFRFNTVARFQFVVTHTQHRKKGICGSLVHHVASLTLKQPEIESLVMLADSEYHAARIYESLGFSATEKLDALCLWPRS